MKTFIAILILSLFCSPVLAQEPTSMPAGSTCNVNGVSYKAFSLDEYKIVAGIYVDYVKLFRENIILNERLQLRLQMEDNYKQQIANAETLITQFKADHEYWVARVKEIQETQAKEVFANKLEKYGLWALVAVETVMIGVFAVRAAARQ